MLESADGAGDDLPLGESAVSTDLSSVDAIIVSVSDIISTLKNNEEESGVRNPHGMHITPPYESEAVVGTYTVGDGRIRTTPVDGGVEVLPTAFITGVNKPDFDRIPEECVYPSKLDQRKQFREEYGYTDDTGSPIELSPEQVEDWESWWQRALSEWEAAVRDNLAEKILLQPSATDGKIKVNYHE